MLCPRFESRSESFGPFAAFSPPLPRSESEVPFRNVFASFAASIDSTSPASAARSRCVALAQKGAVAACVSKREEDERW